MGGDNRMQAYINFWLPPGTKVIPEWLRAVIRHDDF